MPLALTLLYLTSAGAGQAQPSDGDFAVSHVTVATSCREGDTSYLTNGSITATVGPETGACGDSVPSNPTYTVTASPVANSSPLGNTPPFTTIAAYIGFPEGDFFFGNAGAGQYTITVTMINAAACVPTTNPKQFVATVSQAAVTCNPDLAASKTASGERFYPGDVIDYSVVISNNGSLDPALNVVYTDSLDADTALVVGSVQTTQGSVTTGNVSGDTSVAVAVGNVPGGSSVTISYQAMIGDVAPWTEISNQGTVTADNHATIVTDDPATVADDDPTVVFSQDSIQAIPTLGEWGLFGLALLLAAFGLTRLRRVRAS